MYFNTPPLLDVTHTTVVTQVFHLRVPVNYVSVMAMLLLVIQPQDSVSPVGITLPDSHAMCVHLDSLGTPVLENVPVSTIRRHAWELIYS